MGVIFFTPPCLEDSPHLTGAVHFSHFEDKTLKVLRSCKYSLLISSSEEGRTKVDVILPFLKGALLSEAGGIFKRQNPPSHQNATPPFRKEERKRRGGSLLKLMLLLQFILKCFCTARFHESFIVAPALELSEDDVGFQKFAPSILTDEIL